MLPVKIGIYGIAAAMEERRKQLHPVPFTLVYDYYLHLEAAQCKSGRHREAGFEVNTKRQVLRMDLAIPIPIAVTNFLIYLMKTT